MSRDKRYPDNWAEISKAIRVGRAKGRCEARWGGIRCQNRQGGHYFASGKRVQLYCHHLGIPRADGSLGDRTDKSDCRPENLLAVCYACHVRLDAGLHTEARRAKKEARQRAAWEKRGWVQLELAL